MRALIFFSEKKNVAQFVQYLEEELFLLGISAQVIPLKIGEKPVLDFKINSKEDFAISVGGDGTVLRVARLVYPINIPIFPVNFGNLGFITEIKKNEIIQIIQKYKQKHIFFDERLMLEAEVLSLKEKKFKGIALNEAVVSRNFLYKLLELELTIDKEYVCRYRADGLIIATPTGSTAYSLSAGGPILEPDLQNFVITPLCPHSLRVRNLVVSAKKEIAIRVLSEEKQLLTLDGQDSFELQPEDIIVIKAAAHPVKIAKPDQRTFYSVLKEKLDWLD